MPAIEDFPEIDALENRINKAFRRARDSLADRNPEQAPIFNAFSIDTVWFVGEWGQGDGELGEDELEVLIYTNFDNRDEFVQEDINLIDSQVYQTVSGEILSSFNNFFEPTDLMRSSFTGIEPFFLPVDVKQESLLDIIGQDDRVFNLTDRRIVRAEGSNLVREPIEVEEEEIDEEQVEQVEVGEGVEGEPTSIIQFPDLDDLRDRVEDAFEEGKEREIEKNEALEDMMNDLTLRDIFVTGEWGAGTAEFGDDPLTLLLSMRLEGMHRKPFGTTSSNLINTMEGLIESTPDMMEWFSDIKMTAVESQFADPTIERNIEDSPTDRFFNLTDQEVIELEGGEIVTRPVEEAPEPEVEEEVVEEEPEITFEDRIESIEEQLEEEPGEPPVELQQFQISGERVHIPAGKETKGVTPRPPFDFERELYTPGDALTGLPDIDEGIGHAKAAQTFGVEEPPSTFPRTGVYIKYRLFFEGPTHILGLYNDLVTYAGYISILHNGRFKPGRYSSFREFIYRLKEVPERGLGPQLIEELSQQQAAARGIEVTPRLPSGQPAPWLEEKTVIDVVDENIDHEVWDNVTEFIYGEIE